MRVPLATYRLQFSSSFRFNDAKALIPYLSRMGISDVYASPILKARPGSTHGYDVTDPGELNPELGTQEDFDALTAEVQAHGMGWLQDIVPNHMAYSSDNRMLMDVFENGPRSRFSEFFDIFHDHPDPELQTRVLAPFLGGDVEELLQRSEIRLALDADGLAIRYFDWRFPLHLPTYPTVLWHGGGQLSGSMAGDDAPLREFAELRDTFIRLSDTGDSDRKRRQLARAKETLWRLYNDDAMINIYLDGVLEAYNRPPVGPVEQHPLFILLEQQVFKPAHWRVAHTQINYRRFFYITDFIALRIQDPQVFQAIHEKIFELTRTGVFTGLRIDHVDGLYNPRGYLAALRKALPECYIVVEKILELYEFLRTEWPIQGTSGYKACNYINGLYCRSENEDAFTKLYHRFIGSEPDYEQLLFDEKKKILEWRMAGEIDYLTHLAMQLAPSDEPQAAESMKQALIVLMAAFPVYRTYVDARQFTERDRTMLLDTIEKARQKCPECWSNIDRLVELLLPESEGETAHTAQSSAARAVGSAVLERTQTRDTLAIEARRHFLMRFQQFTGPAMAKGFEDTLLYVYNRLLSLNEVGGDPATFGLTIDQFHDFNQRRTRDWPHAMNATSTHDSKRGEDTRARINVLSEIPDRWQQAITRWAEMNEPYKQQLDGMRAPHPNDEYLLYQTLIGALPFGVSSVKCQMSSDEARPSALDTSNLKLETAFHDFPQRIKDYFVKAVREAKTFTNWVDPNPRYEAACGTFVDRILDRSPDNRFWKDFEAFQQEIAQYGIYNSLSQTTLKMTCTGLPDFYQGTELWDFSLVDPDNRRPVDFPRRAEFLEEVSSLKSQVSSDKGRNPTLDTSQFTLETLCRDGRIKMLLIHKGLQARRQNRELFDEGDYLPASVQGSRADHIIAFFRTHGDSRALVVAPRFLTSLVRPNESPLGKAVWQDTGIDLPRGIPPDWRNAITGETLTASGEVFVGDILSEFPTAILLNG
jgi:(1->4)-alpha-D-glucan 1-alpha-D-glucosylmutase